MKATQIDQTVSHISVTQSPSSQVHYYEHLTLNQRIISSSKTESSHTDTASSMYEQMSTFETNKPIVLRKVSEAAPVSFTNGFKKFTEHNFRDYQLLSYQTLRKELAENFHQFYGSSDDLASMSFFSHNVQLFIRWVSCGLFCHSETKWEKYSSMKQLLISYHVNFKEIMFNLRDCMRLGTKAANFEFLIESEAKGILSVANRMRLNIFSGMNRHMILLRLKDIFFAYAYLKQNDCVKTFTDVKLEDFINHDGSVKSYPEHDFLASACLLHLSQNPNDLQYIYENEEIQSL
jgi:hypothetical protein